MNGVKLTKGQWQSLRWISKQSGPVWGGLYDYDGDSDVVVLTERGLIQRVAEAHTYGRAEFKGGFRITDAGRSALTEEPS